MDRIVKGATDRGLMVLLDQHRPDSQGQSELWYTSKLSEQQWIDDWTMLASHFRGNPLVIGADLHNEPHGPGHAGATVTRRPTGGWPPSGPATPCSRPTPTG